MKIVNPSYEILTPLNGEEILKHIELATRTCYKSEDHIKEGSNKRLLKTIMDSKHESVIEHFSISVRLIGSRAMSHQLVRSRIASFSQESQRYCNYSKEKFGKDLTFIRPVDFDSRSEDRKILWHGSMKQSEKNYLTEINLGAPPQEAREHLPNSTKTEVFTTMNLRSWRHFFKTRCSSHAQKEIRSLALGMLDEFSREIPVVFDDLRAEYLGEMR